MESAIVWFRQDLRIDDNPALNAAVQSGLTVVPVYVWAPQEEGRWAPGAASRWWLHQSLGSLDNDLRRIGLRLIIRSGSSVEEIRAIARECRASAVYWNRRYEPAAIARDAAAKEAFVSDGIRAESSNGSLLFEPWSVLTGAKQPYKVFTPFANACIKRGGGAPEPVSDGVRAPSRWPDSLPLRALALEPRIDWAGGIRASWTPGSAGARTALRSFVRTALGQYDSARNLPDETGTSRLSPHLHFGELSPRAVWDAVTNIRESSAPGSGPSTFLKELLWREFAYHLLFHFPRTTDAPLRSEFERFEWLDDPAGLRAWERGRTGYPLVDAGMRELWTTGWMHNRVRMVVASFLVKHLLMPWQLGARWFWDTLVDADVANNTLGWQWTAGCGADAAPFFRVFNPQLQGEKFDPAGRYVKRWCPELAAVPPRWIHAPWKAPSAVLAEAGVALGRTYPFPLVDHSEARARALDAFAEMGRA